MAGRPAVTAFMRHLARPRLSAPIGLRQRSRQISRFHARRRLAGFAAATGTMPPLRRHFLYRAHATMMLTMRGATYFDGASGKSLRQLLKSANDGRHTVYFARAAIFRLMEHILIKGLC